MADKRISQLVERINIANNDVLPIVASGATTTNKVTVSTLQDWMQDNLDVGVTSVGLSMPSAFTVTNSPVTTSGNISVVGAGTVSQYIRGDGSLADFPQGGGGGGSSVNYYLNGSVSQGTIGGVAYLEMNKTPILGAGTDFTINADGYIASFITDAGDPALLEIPAGNWNFETYLQASSAGGTPSFYIELYKVNSGGTATLIASNSATPELIAFGTSTTPYFSALAVPTTTLALTDRLALRYYVTHSGRTITLHTENNTLCQIITTFTTGLTALNGLTAQVQNFATGTSGTDFGISSSTSTHTFNLPTASATNRGALSSADWTTFNGKQNALNGTGFVKISGTTISYDNSTYLTTGTAASTYLPLAGGTLTGTLNGTSANFTNNITIDRSLSSLGNALTLTKGSDADQAWLAFQQGAAADGVWRLGYTGDPYDFRINLGSSASIGTQALRIFETTQNVVIGTSTSDNLSRLQVGGSVTIGGGITLTGAQTIQTSTGNLTLATAGGNGDIILSPNGTGKVGIGTSTPEATGLTVAGGGIIVSLDSGAARRILELYSQSGVAKISASYVGASSYGSLELLTSNLPRLTIADTGAATFSNVVGINRTPTSGYKLDIQGNEGIRIIDNDVLRSLIITPPNSGASATVSTASGQGISFQATNASGNLTFETAGNERMRITSAGNVGIGTASPANKLDVLGGTSITGNLDLLAGGTGAGFNRQISIGSGSAYNYQLKAEGDDFNIIEAGSTSRLRYDYSDIRWYITGGLTISGSLSKGSGSFKIDHPLPEKKDTHHLVHSFVEAPQADNIYRGKIELVDGLAEVNIDEVSGMSEGTFVLLNGNIQCFTSNESGWTAIRGKVEGNILKIEAQDSKCADTISWLVIGERIDQHMKDTDWTDENGKVIVEPLKKLEKESEILNEDLQNQNQIEDESNT
jgi:hypothetical protein